MARTSSKTSSKIVKKIPSSETGYSVRCFTKHDKSGDEYLITENPLKMQFTLWKVLKDKEEFEKMSISNNPLDFDEIIPYEAMYR